MQLVMMLVVVVSILTILSGISVIAGSNKKERIPAIWFLLIAIGASVWSISVGVFLSLTSGQKDSALPLVQTIFISSTLTLVALVGNTNWRYRVGKFITAFFGIVGLILSIVILKSPEIVFSSTEISNSGNTVYFNIGFCTILYGTLILLSAIIAFIALVYRILHTKKHDVRCGNLIYSIGIAITIICSVIFDLIMPLNGRCALMWIGPVTVATTMLGYYYAILRYRFMILSSAWMKILSYVILMTSCAVVYMIIFFIIFTALFKGSSPSIEVILLNFIMILIVLLLMPTFNEVSSFIRSLISTKKIDVAYIVAKLSQSTSQKIGLMNLSSFLAEHMHFDHIDFLIDERLYSSTGLTLSSDEIGQIGSLKTPGGAIWQDFNNTVSSIANEHGITSIAGLKNARGKVFGQIIMGKPLNKMSLGEDEMAQIEMIINLVSQIIDSKM